MNKIVEVYFNNLPPDKYDYTYFDIRFEDGSREFFHHHINNPVPNRDEMIGLTMDDVRVLYRKMFDEMVNVVLNTNKW